MSDNLEDKDELPLPPKEDVIASENKKKEQLPETDPMLPEKKKARRRLVGAIALTIGAVVALPMIFDSEPQPVSKHLLIDVPSREKTALIESKDVKPKTVSKDTKKDVTETQKNVEEKKESSNVSKADLEKQTTEKAKAEADKAKEAEKTKAAEKAKTEPKANEKAKADAKVESDKTKKTTDAKTASPKTEPKTTDKTIDPIEAIAKQNVTDKKEFVIQVAAVTTNKVKEVQDKLSKSGLKSYTQKVKTKDGTERVRIRIGPLSSQKEVNATCAKLNQIKFPCTLVN